MYDETKYIFQEFQKNFSGKKKEAIVLYGVGKNTEELLPKIQNYTIVGLMDGKKKSGMLWGKPILDYDDLLRLRVKTVVVIARPAVIGVIYHRISKFCTRNGITVYDVNGVNLAEIYINQENDIPYFHQSFEDLTEVIKKHKVISFDIFDTLIMRKVLYPADIFAVVEKIINKETCNPPLSFARLRIEAERQLNQEKKNPNLKEIYERIQGLSSISREFRDRLMALEVATEMRFLVPRKRMLELYNAIKGQKKIYLISDMYLPGDILEKILDNCGYRGYEGIYVSCEERTIKEDRLFELFSEEMERTGYDRKDCVHIGDNHTADIMGARGSGLDAFQVMSARELLESSSYRSLLAGDLNFTDHLSVGLLCEKLFNDPFALSGTKGKFRMNNLKDFTYIFVAPIIFYFTMWLMQQVCRTQCDYVLYPSRDACLIEKLCGKICEKQGIEYFPDGEYFYTSRRSVLAATVWEEHDIKRVAGIDFWGNMRQLFKQRFNLDIEDMEGEIPASDEKALVHYLEKYQSNILKQCGEERENYLRYISQTGIPEHDRIAFIDFVAAGKVQNGLEKLESDKEFLGFYFLRREPDRDEIDGNIHVESFYPSKGAYEIDLNVYKYYLFLEMILTSLEPTFHSVSNTGEICFMEETRSREHCEIVHVIQDSILEYGEELASLHPNLLSCLPNRDVPDTVLGFLDQEYTDLDIPEVTSLVLTDEFLSQTFNIFQT